MQYVDDKLVMLEYHIPWAEIVVDFYDTMKNVSSGYASVEYEDAGWEEDDVVKVDILVNGNPIDALSFVSNRRRVEEEGPPHPAAAEGDHFAAAVRGDPAGGGGREDLREGAHPAVPQGRAGEGRQAGGRR